MERLIHLLIFLGLGPFTQSIPRQYILIQQQMTWDDARAYCKLNYIDLATVQTTEDLTNLQLAVGSALTSVWTGLYNDINSWRWSYHDEPMTYANFYAEDPNNSNGRQECVAYYYGDWNDLACDFEFYFFCYDDTQTGNSRYVLITDIMRTWQDALIYCRQHYSDLAVIRTLSDNDVLNVPVPSDDYVWIGLFRDSWKWSDGTNVSTYPINWGSYQPDMTGMDRPCGAADSSGLIDDQFCTDILPFVCMHDSSIVVTTVPPVLATAALTTAASASSSVLPVSKQQVITLKVKSGLNVNDPAVMENILQWIRQKLQVHGIDYAGLTWRLQPDGKVFTPIPEETTPNQGSCSAFPFSI